MTVMPVTVIAVTITVRVRAVLGSEDGLWRSSRSHRGHIAVLRIGGESSIAVLAVLAVSTAMWAATSDQKVEGATLAD